MVGETVKTVLSPFLFAIFTEFKFANDQPIDIA
jgi:hypothetical protein